MTDREKFEAWFEREYKHLESSKFTDIVPHIKYGFFMAWQAALASQQPADDGWIGWGGGDCPVGEFDLVETKWCSGAIVEDCAGEFDWSFDEGDFNIIAYRVVKP